MSHTAPKVKKSVALSGVTAGNTALCTVGRTGNDLHYRGYDILDIANTSEFEEIAHLLVHGWLPNVAELQAYKLQSCKCDARHPARGPQRAGGVAGCHAPDGRDAHGRKRAGLRAAGTGGSQRTAGARAIADRLMASLGSMLLYWHHFTQNGRRITVETDDDSIGAHFLHHAPRPPLLPRVGAGHAHLPDPVCRA